MGERRGEKGRQAGRQRERERDGVRKGFARTNRPAVEHIVRGGSGRESKSASSRG